MEKLIQIQDQDNFLKQLRILINEELSNLLQSLHKSPKDDKLLNRDEVMKLLNICSATLWKRMNDGSITYHKIGRKVFFKEAEVRNCLDN